MTYEEAVAQCDPFDVSYIWKRLFNLDSERYRYVRVIRTSDWQSTAFNFDRAACVNRIRKVADDFYTWDAVDIDRLSGSDRWHQGSIDDMVVWAKELFQ